METRKEPSPFVFQEWRGTKTFSYLGSKIFPLRVNPSSRVASPDSVLIHLKQSPGALVAQWVKCGPADLAVPSSSPAGSEIFSTVNRVPLPTAFHYHLPIVLIMTEKDVNRKSSIHPSIHQAVTCATTAHYFVF